MRIGPHTLESPLILAPMAGVSDKPFRMLCRRHGAGLAVSEMLSANTSLRGTRKTVLRLDHDGEPGPISVQILGTDPFEMAEAARANVGHGADIIDINMGCPAKKVCRVAAGSALLRDEPLVARILEQVVNAVTVPVTLKIRTGWSAQQRNALQIARIAEQSGIAALTIHGRTRACGFSGEAEYETIRQVKAATTLPVIANGDIDSPQKARQVLQTTGADALMIGRAAQGQPWLFDQIGHYLRSGSLLAPPDLRQRRDLVLEHLDAIHAFYGNEQGVRVARKHILWYTRGLAGAAEWRAQLTASRDAEQQRQLVDDFLARADDERRLAA